ncbi:hypothetical protein A2943_02800 [Candidatus Adlerbacteria bacterium RIFCSPLOWO2_01_FULL_51_16]|uniref:Uncharacterized protein n=1 Tax=Candidatus Adlerbacteria bacterium RIFCSPLOWO2_01_FULL_51_16 TaxID=1797243 RepID=A0A1F4XI55_9BACT|nr:MAG: hypothetical protein A2943_02800 [Candidatus Adlerbacteria bacterium RIFCSPLOWO2_01_FULL_51_16]
MKTITELNNHWWYRTVKVLFIFFIGSAFLVSLFAAWGESQVSDYSLSKVTCLDGRISTVASIEKVYGSAFDANEFCGNYLYSTDWQYKRDWSSLADWIFWIFFWAALAVLILRGSFYYIALGKFNPPE